MSLSGNQKSSAEAYASCYGDVISETFAFAAAKASADAGCYSGYKNIDVRTDVEARVKADTNEYSGCTIRTKKTGLSKADADGGANAGSVRRPPAQWCRGATTLGCITPELLRLAKTRQWVLVLCAAVV